MGRLGTFESIKHYARCARTGCYRKWSLMVPRSLICAGSSLKADGPLVIRPRRMLRFSYKAGCRCCWLATDLLMC